MPTPVRSESRKPLRFRFRLWEKKRGARRTGSPWLGRAGEVLFWASMFLLGVFSLSELIVSQWVRIPGGTLPDWGVRLLLVVFSSLIAAGIGGLVYSVLQVRTSAERRSMLVQKTHILEPLPENRDRLERFPAIPSDQNLTNSPGVRLKYRLPILQSPGNKLLIIAVCTLIWNAVVAVFLVLVVNQYPPDTWDRLSLLVVLFFGAVGLAALYHLIRVLVTASALGPTSVEISDHPLLPSCSYRIYVAQMGQHSVKRLQLSLVCDEHVSYRQGTDTRSESRRVFQCPVFVREDFPVRPGLPFEHECELAIPPSVMHSLLTEHNAIEWKLVVRGESLRWPPYERSFPIMIYPASPTRSADDSHGTAD